MNSIFESLMLICFAISWPVSITKAITTKIVTGKSWIFMAIVCIGYLFGIIHKTLYSLDWIISLYIINFCMVTIDLSLYFKYRKKLRELKHEIL